MSLSYYIFQKHSFPPPSPIPQSTSFICSLNFLFSILGYPLVMALSIPFSGDILEGENIYFTYPYRFLQIIVALLTLFVLRGRPFPRLSWKILGLALFWILYFSRGFWDLFISPPYGSPFAEKLYPGREWYFASYLIVMFLPLLGVFRGADCIDFPKTLKWILIFGGVGLLFSFFNMRGQVESSWTGELGRVSASRMLHTQALGNFGCYMSIAALWSFSNFPRIIWKLFSFLVLILGIFMMIKAGSRGPIFGFSIVICAWASFRNKNFVLSLLIAFIFVGLAFLLQDQIIDLIKKVSPVMAERMSATINEGNTSGRDTLWAIYWAECLKNPIFGFQLDMFGYPHNMFLDGFMMFGLIAGWIVTILIFVACFSIFKALRKHIPNSWWVLFLLGQLTQAFTQSGFGLLALQAPLLLLFIYEQSSQKSTAYTPR